MYITFHGKYHLLPEKSMTPIYMYSHSTYTCMYTYTYMYMNTCIYMYRYIHVQQNDLSLHSILCLMAFHKIYKLHSTQNKCSMVHITLIH